MLSTIFARTVRCFFITRLSPSRLSNSQLPFPKSCGLRSPWPTKRQEDPHHRAKDEHTTAPHCRSNPSLQTRRQHHRHTTTQEVSWRGLHRVRGANQRVTGWIHCSVVCPCARLFALSACRLCGGRTRHPDLGHCMFCSRYRSPRGHACTQHIEPHERASRLTSAYRACLCGLCTCILLRCAPLNAPA
jgi:hypothetical protein